jgi:hypothetical protein
MKSNTRTLLLSLMTLAMASLLLNSCKKSDDSGTTISDENFYSQLGYGLVKCYTDIYNQNLAGKPTGSQNLTVSGPMGGTVVITGTTTYDDTHGITTTDLLFDMTGVEYSLSHTENNKTWTIQVTLNGPVTYTGSFSPSYTSLNHQSAGIRIKGTVNYDGTTRNIDESGEVSINRSSTISVNIFGHKASW